jgi:hypothetical protein
MLGKKKVVMLAAVLMATLAVGVYAGIQLSETLSASWTVQESGTNLALWWQENTPSGELYRGQWYQTQIGLKNTGAATYHVIVKFQIRTNVSLTANDMKLQYSDGSAWHDLPLTPETVGDRDMLVGSYGLADGFDVGPGYNVLTWFQYYFEGSAPLDGAYYFEAWVEQVA